MEHVKLRKSIWQLSCFQNPTLFLMLMSLEVYLQLKETLNISKFAPHRHMFFYFDIVMILKSNAYPAIGNTNFSYAL